MTNLESKLKLTRENYHSLEANQQYLSVSTYKNFLECEARALAILKGEFVNNFSSEALLFGSLLHAWNEGIEEFEQFLNNNQQLYSTRGATKGQLKSNYNKVYELINRIEADNNMLKALQGQKEVIFTAEMFGIDWKICIDSYNPEKKYFADLKTMADIYSKFYNSEYEGYVDFIRHYKYDLQMIVYSEIEKIATGRKENLNPILVVVTKENPPDTAIFNSFLYIKEVILEKVQRNVSRIIDLKAELVKPKMCNRCEYCRKVKKTPILKYEDFSGGRI